MKLFLSGNEATAHGLKDAGLDLAAAYPGTPSTEILETIQRLGGIKASWHSNEKTALETAAGACFAGGRSAAVMKHVGLNVAADPLMTLSYTGVKGGLVIISCDDPNAYSSQNEQDNRNYAKFAKIPMFEPADSQEAYDFSRLALELSEEYDTPVLFRMTTRIAHSKCLVEASDAIKRDKNIGFDLDADKYVMMPKQARVRHRAAEERLLRLAKYSEKTPLNRLEEGQGDILVISSGISYQYIREVAHDMPVFKMGFTWPLPVESIRKAAASYKKVICAEELDPFLEENLLVNGVKLERRSRSFYAGEFSPRRIRSYLENNTEPDDFPVPADVTPPHPPALCPGCPHFTALNIVKELGLKISGDIGCYTLGALPPFNTIHAVLDMAASISMACGIRRTVEDAEGKQVAAIIGDSTFIHNGITALIDAVYTGAGGLVLLLDNRITAMTGRQGHPGSGAHLDRSISDGIDYELLMRSIGVSNVYTVDPYLFQESLEVITKALAEEELSVVILKRECVLLKKPGPEKYAMNDNCTECGECLEMGCPSIRRSEGGSPRIDPVTCTGCGICSQICDHDAIEKKGAD